MTITWKKNGLRLRVLGEITGHQGELRFLGSEGNRARQSRNILYPTGRGGIEGVGFA